MNTLENKEILIIGGSGTMGKTLTKKLLAYKPKGIRIFSRTEALQWKMQEEFRDILNEKNENGCIKNNISFILGDIKNQQNINMAMKGVNAVFYLAALKQLPAAELNPIEAINNNITGAINVIVAASENKIDGLIYTNTDKSVMPINTYGYTKGLAERLIINSNIYTGYRSKFSCVRYGNVLGSTGSILELFEKQIKKNNEITITDNKMCRFYVTKEEIADFIIFSYLNTKGAEIFIPKMKSLELDKFCKYIYPNVKKNIIGVKKGEKINEDLISKYESHMTIDKGNYYIVDKDYYNKKEFYVSTENSERLTKNELFKMLNLE